ncbi:hypothetical protein B0H13DRAFT_1876034 [Mycena leptocephala]|nr:hypothetical protein B0H13DRAFT_1876034 [Mycena leptocephala]
MQCVGVTRCTNIEKMLALYTPPSLKTSKVPVQSVPSKRKPDHEHDPSSRVVQVPRTTQTHALYVPSSPASPASCSSTPSLSPLALFLSLPLPVDADADDRWARGQVFVLSGFGTWLAGIYAQDMVRAFGRISSGRALDSEVESRFESTFPIVPIYVQSYKTSEHLPSIREPPWQELCLGVHDGESNMECVLDGLDFYRRFGAERPEAL